MTEKIKHRLSGPREGVWLMRLLAELVEKNPQINFPGVEFGKYGSDSVRFHVWGHNVEYDYRTSTASRAAQKRLAIENEFNTITEFFGPDLEWTANHPSDGDRVSFNKDYFILTAIHSSGVELSILAQRSDVGEQVQALDSGPDITETDGGYMQAVRTSVTVWKPNINLTALARPGFALGAGEQRLAVGA